MRDNLRTANKLNTPYNTNKEYAKKANKINSHEYNYEFGSEENTAARKNLSDSTSRYNYEFGNVADFDAKDSPLARGANIANAFSYPLAASADTASRTGNFAAHNEEYALESSDNSALQREVNERNIKKRYQDNLRQNYNVEISKDQLIDDEE